MSSKFKGKKVITNGKRVNEISLLYIIIVTVLILNSRTILKPFPKYYYFLLFSELRQILKS